MFADEVAKRGSGTWRQPPGTAAGAAPTDALGFQNERAKTRGRTYVGNGASGDAGADDHDIGSMVTTKAGVRGNPGGR